MIITTLLPIARTQDISDWRSIEVGERHRLLLTGDTTGGMDVEISTDGTLVGRGRTAHLLRGYTGEGSTTVLEGPLHYRCVRFVNGSASGVNIAI